jgi:hypothetical protein
MRDLQPNENDLKNFTEATRTTCEQMACVKRVKSRFIFSISASRSASGCARRASPSAPCGNYHAITRWN